jgi:hypothetical protein
MIIDISQFPLNSIHIATDSNGLVVIRIVDTVEPNLIKGRNLFSSLSKDRDSLSWGYDREDAAEGYYSALTSIIHVPPHLTSVTDIINTYPELFL